jgi:hypothetical protein
VLFMKTPALSLAVFAALAAAPALAEHESQAAQQYQQQYQQQQYQQQYQQPQHQAYAVNPDDSCDHDRVHQGYTHADFNSRRGGHYELRTVQKWQEGYWNQVWVPGACFGIHVRVCAPGSYQNQWVPGRYVTTQEYVWVEHRHRRHWRYGRHWSYRD